MTDFMNRFIYCLIAFFTFGAFDVEGQKTLEEQFGEALPQYSSIINNFPDNPTDPEIIDLARELSYLSTGNRYDEFRPKARQYYEKIKSILLRTPGHAEAFERKYQKAKSDVISGESYWSEVQRASEGLRNLEHLPSPETMRVLGEMLEETKGAKKEDPFPRQPKESFERPSSAAECAVVTLHKIGIENPPDANAPYIDIWLMGDTISFHPLWHTWWQEVKDGKRTYKFKGSDVVYDYNGPVRTFRKDEFSGQTSNSKPVRADRIVKRDMTITEKKPVSESRGPVILTIATVVALLIGMRLLWTAKQKSHR